MSGRSHGRAGLTELQQGDQPGNEEQMATRNDITGDKLQSKFASKAYLTGWDFIFQGKKKTTTEEPEVVTLNEENKNNEDLGAKDS